MRKFFFTLLCVLLLAERAMSKLNLVTNIEYLNTFRIPAKKIALYGDKGHFEKVIHDNFSKLIISTTKADSNYNCIFLEFDSRFQTYFNEYSRNPNFSVEDIFNSAAIQFKNDRVILSSKEVSVYFREVFEASKRSKLKIIAADIDFSTAEGLETLKALDPHLIDPENIESLKNFATQIIENRNKSLAKKITAYLDSNICTKIMVYFGDGHFQKFYSRQPVGSVQHFLTLHD